MPRCPLLLSAILVLPSTILAQSMAEVAEREKQKRAGKPAGRVYTNEDLTNPEAKPKGSSTPAPAASATPRTPASEDRDERGSESAWRARADGQRAAIKAAEKRIVELQVAIDRESVVRRVGQPQPGDAMKQDPNNLRTDSDNGARLAEELTRAKADLAAAQKGLDDVEEEARRKSVPPGWLRER